MTAVTITAAGKHRIRKSTDTVEVKSFIRLYFSEPAMFNLNFNTKPQSNTICSLLLGFVLFFFSVSPAHTAFVRGDVNNDKLVNISDVVTIVSYLFQGGTETSCEDAADTNDDGQLDISDAVYLINYLFAGDARLPEPFPFRGEDPTEDHLDCARDPEVVMSCAAEVVCAGDYIIDSLEDIQEAAECTTITGKLEVKGYVTVSWRRAMEDRGWLTDLHLPCLQVVGGDLTLDNNVALQDMDISNITSVGGTLLIQEMPSLTDINMPNLIFVGGALHVAENDFLLRMNMPELISVESRLSIARNSGLETADLSNLALVGDRLTISRNGQLDNLQMFQLETITNNDVDDELSQSRLNIRLNRKLCSACVDTMAGQVAVDDVSTYENLTNCNPDALDWYVFTAEEDIGVDGQPITTCNAWALDTETQEENR